MRPYMAEREERRLMRVTYTKALRGLICNNCKKTLMLSFLWQIFWHPQHKNQGIKYGYHFLEKLKCGNCISG